jgi:hypothetical protein
MIGVKKQQIYGALTGLVTLALIVVAATTTLTAQTTLLAPRMVPRAVAAGDVSNAAYKLPSTTEYSYGLTTIALGEPAYLEVQVDATIPANNIAGVTWTLTSKPAGSNAVLVDSPLTSLVPIAEPSDRVIYQVAGRTLLRADVVGPYIVSAIVTAGSSGTTTVAQTFIAGTYVGVAACQRCHSGGLATPMTQQWSQTAHAGIFTAGINGGSGTTGANCFPCHTVGYDVNATLPNGGFSALMKQLNWTWPTKLQPGNWDAVPAQLQNVANIQCENCHGPGSQHANYGGDTLAISVPNNSGACQRCHDAPTHHVKGTEWNASMHAVTTRDPSGTGREGCVGCHTANGFIQRMNGQTVTNTAYRSIDCGACHEPHGKTNPGTAPHLIRSLTAVTLADGTKIDAAGSGALCMNCHQARVNASTYVPTTAPSSRFGPHHGPQADMLAGTNGFTYGQQIPSSAHIWAADDTCVTCHMQATATTDAAFLKAGGHTFKPAFTDATGKKVELVAACQSCHGKQITTFNFQLFDYNNDGKIEGVQTEVQNLLDQLSTMLPPNNQVKTALTIDSTWTRPQLEAAYNWQFVANDGSKGVHNTAYAVGLLKTSIANLAAGK